MSRITIGVTMLQDFWLRILLTLALAAVAVAGNADQSSTSTPDRPASVDNRSRPEIAIGDYLLKSRAKIDKLLGPPRGSGECADTTGRQFEYKDGSYACVRNGRVVLFSYNVRTPATNTQELLRIVGIGDWKQPYEIGAGAHGWFFQRGNPLRVGNGMADLVIVFPGRPPNMSPNVTVEMDGSHPIPGTVPKPEAAAVREYLKLYQSDVPGVFEDATVQGGALRLYVSGQWDALPLNFREQILESLGERWQAVNRGYGNSVHVTEISIRRRGTGAVVGKWPQ